VSTPTDELPPFETRLLAELTEVVEDRRRAAVAERTVARPRRTRLAVATAGVAAIALALAVAPGLTRDTGQRAFAVRELEGGVIQIVFDRDFRDGSALGDELRSYGVDVEMHAVPASPSAVGHIHSTEGPPPGETPGFDWGPDGSDTAFTVDPAVFRGRLKFHLGVEPAPGEGYTIAEEVFEPGEVLGGLHCALGEPLHAEQLVPYLDELGLGVEWETIVPAPGDDPGMANVDQRTEAPDGEVMWGYARDADTVRITVRPDGATFDPRYYSPRLSDEPCSPDQAAAWD
jgi:hypothetical protein